MFARSKLAHIELCDDGQTQYTCVECSAQYTDKEELELHLCTHINEYRYLCGMCGTGLKRKEHLERHIQGHLEVRPYVCEDCGKAFKRKEHLGIHRTIHKGDKSLVCSLCQKSFYRKDHLQKHIQTHNKHFLKQNMLDVKVEETEEAEDSFEDMPVITSVEGNVNEEDYGVEIKEEYMDDEEPMDESMDPSMDPLLSEIRPYACKDCGKTYKRKDHLKFHSYVHMKKEKVCSDCGKAFHTARQLYNHVNMVHVNAYYEAHRTKGVSQLKALLGDEIDIEVLTNGSKLIMPKLPKSELRPHECRICHRKFKRRQHLKTHFNIHTREQSTILCGLCNQSFANNEMFENHQCVTSTEDNAEYETDSQQISLSHPLDAKKENSYPEDFVEVIHDPDVSEDLESSLPTPLRVYVCKYCAKPFKRKDHYRIHLHIHTGVKSFFCTECDKGFYRKDHLQKHMQVHTREKKSLKPPKPNMKVKPKKELPALYPIDRLSKKDIKPEITIHAPSNTKLRVPLQIKVPYQMVMSLDNGEQRAVTIDPQASIHEIES